MIARSLTLAVIVLCVFVGKTNAADDHAPGTSQPVDFVRDIQPIFAKSCYRCHGPKGQKGGLRLHVKSAAFDGGDNGVVIEPGKGAESRLVQYVAGLDEDHMMPPEGAGSPLSEEQVERLSKWIDQGATWPTDPSGTDAVLSTHWSFQPPTATAPPEVKDQDWVQNPIDRYILARLESEGMHPSVEADRATLIRRVSLDLIGLPPSPAEVSTFVNDRRVDAYDRLVDRLLASPHYGERWGRRWLDRARYADTNGYEKDRERPIWPYRDWVIKALNADMPFDQFTVEQLAGDMLPGATPSQRIATGFHRNTMTNEEGGIDVEEFRFASIVDRVMTTGTVWLGLTIQCAQCHTHKYDPITQREYYQFFAFLNNADEPEYEIPSGENDRRRRDIENKISQLEAGLEDQFPLPGDALEWRPLIATEAKSTAGVVLTPGADGSLLANGEVPATDRYTVTFNVDGDPITSLRLQALTDPSLPGGPGRTRHGNFVISGIKGAIRAKAVASKEVPVEFSVATADFTQNGFDVSGLFDDDKRTGWAVDDLSGDLNKNRTLDLTLREPIDVSSTAQLTLTIEQEFGGGHDLGKFRILAGSTKGVPSSDGQRRGEHLAAKLAAWEAGFRAVNWEIVAPSEVVSHKHATMIVQPDGSVLATGDKPNNDVYDVDLPIPPGPPITALRLEVLPDPSLPDGGPGRAPLFSVGDFILTEVSLSDGKTPIALRNASQDYSEPERPASLAIDGVPDTGWTVKGGVGRPHAAVFELQTPVNPDRMALTLTQFGIHQMTIGRFRVSVTRSSTPVKASGLPAEIESILTIPTAERTANQTAELKHYYLSVAPELAGPNAAIAALRRTLPRDTTTLVMVERPEKYQRATYIHKRGEFLRPTVPVSPKVPAFLPPLPKNATHDRLSMARWLVDGENPLVGRVVMNSTWHAFFGRGLVSTVDDFGTRGELPTHPELLDWLAIEFPRRGWSQKAMHRLIVTSATYRQSSVESDDRRTKDPLNLLLGRGARFRVEAEVVRDIALKASGLLCTTLGGPSVFPPQPDGVSSLSYGQTAWVPSVGLDRYRRGLYTYQKRTSPFAAFITFDGPTSETACVRRERSNTPLQALTLLNDAMYIEASRALALSILEEGERSAGDRLRDAFERLLSRPPTQSEADAVAHFHDEKLAEFQTGKLDPAKIAGPVVPEGIDRADLAAWTVVARALLNLDETITRE